MRASSAFEESRFSPEVVGCRTRSYPAIWLLFFLVMIASPTRLSAQRSTRSDVETFERRRKALAANDVAGRLALAEWCTESIRARRRAGGSTFRARAAALFTEILKIAPGDVRAHRGLGHVLKDGKWLDSDVARSVAVERLRRVLRAGGLVSYAHGWETPDGVRNRRAGLVYAGGKWRTADQARAARGFARIDGKWVEPKRALAIATARRLTQLTGAGYVSKLRTHVICCAPSASPLASAEEAATLDRAVSDHLALLGKAGSASPFQWPARVFYLQKRGDLDVFKSEYGYDAKMAPRWAIPMADGSGLRAFRDRDRRWLIVVYADRPPEEMRALAIYGLIRAALEESYSRAPFWIADGLAVAVQAIRAPGFVAHTAGGKPANPYATKTFASAKALRAHLKKAAKAADPKAVGALTIERLLARESADATELDVAHAVALITWLTGRFPGAVGRCLAERAGPGKGAAAFEKATGKTPAEVQAGFGSWLEKE